MRRFYNYKTKTLNLSKKSINDSKQNSKISLPRQLRTMQEACVNVRGDRFEEIVRDHHKNHTKDGVQPSNLTMEETRGLRSLLRRSKAHELTTCLTDKSGKMCIVGRQEYHKMGSVHTAKDKKVTMQTVLRCADHLDCHTAMQIKITGVGMDWDHQKRVRESYMGGNVHPPCTL